MFCSSNTSQAWFPATRMYSSDKGTGGLTPTVCLLPDIHSGAIDFPRGMPTFCERFQLSVSFVFRRNCFPQLESLLYSFMFWKQTAVGDSGSVTIGWLCALHNNLPFVLNIWKQEFQITFPYFLLTWFLILLFYLGTRVCFLLFYWFQMYSLWWLRYCWPIALDCPCAIGSDCFPSLWELLVGFLRLQWVAPITVGWPAAQSWGTQSTCLTLSCVAGHKGTRWGDRPKQPHTTSFLERQRGCTRVPRRPNLVRE